MTIHLKERFVLFMIFLYLCSRQACIIMATPHFDRWQHVSSSSGPFKVYKKYYEELNLYYWSCYCGHKLTYKGLKKMGVDWNSDPNAVLPLPANNHSFDSMRKWSNSYNALQVWTRLQVLLSLTSILETFIDTIAYLAVESDPGVLINSSKSIDGLTLLKKKRVDSQIIKSRIMYLTKDTWDKRIAAFDTLFGGHPTELDIYKNDLEALRRKRNSVGHAFGRDIEQSRKFEEIVPLPIDGIREDHLLHFFDITFQVAQAIDKFLLDEHIGEYQALFAYHVFYQKNKGKNWNNSEYALYFRRMYCQSQSSFGRDFFRELVSFYHSI